MAKPPIKTTATINHPSKQELAKRMSANLGGKKKVLCIHAGPISTPRFVHESFKSKEWEAVWLSANPEFKPDILAHPANMADIADGTMDAVWAPHTIKHLYQHEVPLAFKEALRVLKTDGTFLLFTPDLETVCEVISRKGVEATVYTSRAGKVTGLDILYGSSTYLSNGELEAAPKTGFTGGFLGKELRDTGFRDIIIKLEKWNIWAKGMKRAKDTKDNKLIRYTGDEVNARMQKRDNLEQEPEKPVDTHFPFRL
jgi:SAM-dependent methyltransferase